MKEKRIHVGRRAAWTALCFVLAAAWVLLPPAASAKTAGMREAGEAAVQITENGTVKTGLAVYGDDVQGNCGLSRNIYFLTQDQLEDIKDKQSADGYGLGSDAYLRDQVYSSYEHHGEGAYHYTRASGLSIPAMLQALTGSHYGNVKYFFIKARDGYNSTQAVNSINELQYFAPGDAAGVPSAAPMIALYKSTNEYVNRADGVVPDSAARLEPGREVLAFGQEEVNTPNNCQFVKGVDQVAAVREFGVLPESMTSSSTKGMLRIDAMLHGTIRDRSYTYGSGGSAVTYRVRGLSLDDAAAEMGLGELLADRADYRLRLTGADGKTVLVPQNRLSQATLAWDSDTAPAGQTGYYAAYLADGTADTAVLANVTAIDVVSASGQTVTSRVTAPKAPTGLRLTYASAASLRLTWKKVSDASGYRVYRSTGSHGSWTLRKTCSGRTAAFTDSGLTPGRLYRYRVVASRTAYGDSYDSSPSAAVKAEAAIRRPALAVKKSGRKAVRVSWKKISGADGYQLCRAASKKGRYKKIATVRGAAKTSFKDRKVRRGRHYYYKVRACKKIGGRTYYSSYSPVRGIRR